MTSQINYSGIKTDFPKAGIDNDSQGFRDNFAATAAALAQAKTEITALQNNAVLSNNLSVANDPVINNLQGSTLTNGLYSQLNGILWDQPGFGAMDVDLDKGPVQKFDLTDTNSTLTFKNWADANYSAVRVLITSNQTGFQNVGFSTVGGGTIHVDTDYPASTSSDKTMLTVGGEGVASVSVVTPGSGFTTPTSITFTGANSAVPPTANATYKITGVVNAQAGSGSGFVIGDQLAMKANPAAVFTVSQISNGTSYISNVSVPGGASAISGVSIPSTALSSVSLLSSAIGSPALNSSTLAGMAVTGTGGQFSCTATTLTVNQAIVITGTNTGNGSIIGYSTGTTYYIIATNGSTTFTLSTSIGGSAITSTAGTLVGLTFTTYLSGQFSCTSTQLAVTQAVVVTGTNTGTATISGYASGNTYYITSTNGSTNFTLSTTQGGPAITTTPGTIVGLTFTLYTSGQFTCSSASLAINQAVVVTGTSSGSGSISGYTSGNVYYITSTNGSTSFTLSNAIDGPLIATNAGALAGLTFTAYNPGQFSCTTTPLSVGQAVTISGTPAGTGTIAGYVSGTTYYIVATNTSTLFTLSATMGGQPITTTPGTATGLSFGVSSGTSSAGVFNCSSTNLLIGQAVTVTGNLSGTGNISGYVTGNTYYITSTTGTSFTMSTTLGGQPVSNTPGTLTGLLFSIATQGVITGLNIVNGGSFTSPMTGVYRLEALTGSGTDASFAFTFGIDKVTILTQGNGYATNVPPSVNVSGSPTVAPAFSVALTNKKSNVKVVDAWTVDGGANVYLKYVGEFETRT
jgi:hypothetical protein